MLKQNKYIKMIHHFSENDSLPYKFNPRHLSSCSTVALKHIESN